MPGLPNVADEYGTLRGTSGGADRWGPFGPSVAAEPMNLLAAMHGRPPPGVSFDDQMQAFLQSMEDQDDEFGDEFGDDSKANDSGEDDSGDDDSGEDASEGDGSAGVNSEDDDSESKRQKASNSSAPAGGMPTDPESPGLGQDGGHNMPGTTKDAIAFLDQNINSKVPAAVQGYLVRLPLLTECTVG